MSILMFFLYNEIITYVHFQHDAKDYRPWHLTVIVQVYVTEGVKTVRLGKCAYSNL